MYIRVCVCVYGGRETDVNNFVQIRVNSGRKGNEGELMRIGMTNINAIVIGLDKNGVD